MLKLSRFYGEPSVDYRDTWRNGVSRRGGASLRLHNVQAASSGCCFLCTTSLTECVALFSLQATGRIVGSETGAPVIASAAAVAADVPAGGAGVAVGETAADAVAQPLR